MELKIIRSSFTAIVIFMLVVLVSCSPVRHIEEGRYLITKNIIRVEGSKTDISKDELYALAQPRTNKKFLGVWRIKLSLYNWGMGGKRETKFRKWLKETVGERPNLFDSTLATTSSLNMKLYLDKTGYFNSGVDFTANYYRKKRVRVMYKIYPTEPYFIRNVRYPINEPVLAGFIQRDIGESKLRSGNNYSAFDLDDERDRIATSLQRRGYYFFDRNYIYFEVDSALNSHQLDIYVYIKDRLEEGGDSSIVPDKAFRRYQIGKVFIRTDYSPSQINAPDPDTMIYTTQSRVKGSSPTSYGIIYQDELRIRPQAIVQSVFIRPGQYFSSLDIVQTRSRISEIGLFSYSNMRFREVKSADTVSGQGILDCHIDLGRRKVHQFTVETEGTNNAGRLGVGLNFAYQNNNIFRSSEIFRIKARFALEAQKAIGGTEQNDATDLPLFNTVESGIDLSVDFPRFLVPVKQERFPKYFRPKTTVRLGFGLEKRPEYDRTFTNLAFGYEWKESDTKRHQFFPFEWNAIDVRNSDAFQELIDQEPNDRIRNQYTDHIIFSMRYSFIFNNQDIRKLKNFIYFRGNAELAGNLPYLYQSTFGGRQDSLGNYTILGIRYAQYVRADFDIRYYNIITRNTTMVYRILMGAGIPYGNANVLPLEKGFYSGGANGMRGWQFRTLGPGGYSNFEDQFDRTGDFQIEGNVEYRFPVYRFIKMALFVDIGNVWLLHENESYPGGVFRIDRFYKELAMDAGLGLRFDFNFFILRVDVAAPVRDPEMPESKRWVMDNLQFKDVLINFGIGYPF